MAIEDHGGTALGRLIELLATNHLDKSNNRVAIAAHWFSQGVKVILDVPLSSILLAVQKAARQDQKIVLFAASVTSALNGKSRSPYGVQCSCNAYSLTKCVVDAALKTGGKRWSSVTSGYAAGLVMESDSSQFIHAVSGSLTDSVRHPVGTKDVASFLFHVQIGYPSGE